MKGKVLAIDYGSKRVGIATGDAEFGIAFPRGVLENKGVPILIAEIKKLCDELEVDLVVVGLPLNMEREHEINKITNDVRYFVKELREALEGIEVELFDERLSTFEGKELMEDIKKRSAKAKLGRDAYAAQIILQRFFAKDCG
jgi:putative Holliday junction resolvase